MCTIRPASSALAALLLYAASVELAAQPQISVRPDAVTLRTLWSMVGIHGEEYIGLGLANLGDLNGDSLCDFAVRGSGELPWRVFFGARPQPKVTPAFALTTPGVVAVATGRFFGSDRPAMIYRLRGANWSYDRFAAHRLLNSRPADSPSTYWQNYVGRQEYPDSGYYIDGWAVADLEGDGDDELLIYASSILTRGELKPWSEVRIHLGGPDFTLERPSIILVDPNTPAGGDGNTIAVADLDGDRRLDVAVSQKRKGSGWHLLIYWGDVGWSMAERGPDRALPIDWAAFSILDADGDRTMDIATERVALFLSGSGRSARDRDYRLADADVLYRGTPTEFNFGSARAGYLNDRRYEALVLRTRLVTGNNEAIELLSGGPTGPDSTVDAAFVAGEAGSRNGVPIGDCNGDGWDDYLTGGAYNRGVAHIVAGGPYIPRDAAMGAVQVADGVRSDAFSVWPQPARDVVNVAWRGDLREWPRSLVVHDVNGRFVAGGAIDDGAPAASWTCLASPPGIYLMTLRDAHGRTLATASIIKQ